jgi:hypothetical protein
VDPKTRHPNSGYIQNPEHGLTIQKLDKIVQISDPSHSKQKHSKSGLFFQILSSNKWLKQHASGKKPFNIQTGPTKVMLS